MFQKGVSGNPKGKPLGSGATGKYRKLLESHAPDLIAAVVKSALGGDTAAQKICMDRLIPSYRPQGMPIISPASADTPILEQAQAVFSAMAAGDVPAEGWIFLKACRLMQELSQGEVLERRIENLERSLQAHTTDTDTDHDLDLDGNDDQH